MDAFDRQRFAAVYRLLAEILERDRSDSGPGGEFSHALGDLARRIFVGTAFDPPDELMEHTAEVLRTGDQVAKEQLADRLRSHAEHLDALAPPE